MLAKIEFGREGIFCLLQINGNGGPNRYGPQGHTDPKKVFVGGLPLEATKENLQEALSQYGEVVFFGLKRSAFVIPSHKLLIYCRCNMLSS